MPLGRSVNNDTVEYDPYEASKSKFEMSKKDNPEKWKLGGHRVLALSVPMSREEYIDFLKNTLKLRNIGMIDIEPCTCNDEYCTGWKWFFKNQKETP